jgi:hypothetical protein
MTVNEKKALLDEFTKFLEEKECKTEAVKVRRTFYITPEVQSIMFPAGSYMVGDVIDFTLSTGEEVSAMAMRQEADGMLFVFVDCLKDEYPMNEDNTNLGGYETSDLRKTLQEKIFPTFPDYLKTRMKPVYGEDKLRLLTEQEVFGENPYGEHDDVVRLEPMKQRKNRIASQGKGTDEWEWYWLQNRVEDTASGFALVRSAYGCAGYAAASSARGVRPAFKI